MVTLRGTVTSLMVKTTAEEDARNVSGVFRVKNHLKVRPKVNAENETLERKIASALSIDPLIDRFEIAIEAYAGYVTLSGTVSTSFEKQRVEEVVGRINGVTDIRNNISYLYTWK